MAYQCLPIRYAVLESPKPFRILTRLDIRLIALHCVGPVFELAPSAAGQNCDVNSHHEDIIFSTYFSSMGYRRSTRRLHKMVSETVGHDVFIESVNP